MEETSVKSSFRDKILRYYERYMLGMGVIGQMLFFTQGIKIFVEKSAADVSILAFLIGLVSTFSWLIYGILIKNRVVIYSNIFAFSGAVFVILGIIIYS